MKKEDKDQIEKLESEIASEQEPDVNKYIELSAVYRYLKPNEKKSRELLDKALELQTQILAKPDIDYVKEGLTLVAIYQALKKEELAKLTCEKLLEYLDEQPENAETFRRYAEVYSRLDDNDTATKYYEKSIELNPDDAETLIGLISIYTDHLHGTANFEKAVEYLTLLKKVDPDNYYIEFAEERIGEFGRLASTFADLNGNCAKSDYTRVIIDTTAPVNFTKREIEFIRKEDKACYIILALGIIAFVAVVFMLIQQS